MKNDESCGAVPNAADGLSIDFGVSLRVMNLSDLLIYVAFPAIFLIVATANPGNMAMKIVCIALAYFSLVWLDGSVSLGDAGLGTGVMADKNTSPFGLAVMATSLWAFVLIGYEADKRRKKDSER
jgi:hypothetical protein